MHAYGAYTGLTHGNGNHCSTKHIMQERLNWTNNNWKMNSDMHVVARLTQRNGYLRAAQLSGTEICQS